MQRFYFEGNQCWGWIENRKRLAWLVASHIRQGVCHSREEAIDFLRRARNKGPLSRVFGLYSEYDGKTTLGEWMERNGIRWPCEKEVKAAQAADHNYGYEI